MRSPWSAFLSTRCNLGRQKIFKIILGISSKTGCCANKLGLMLFLLPQQLKCSAAKRSIHGIASPRTETEQTAQKQIEIHLSSLTQVVPPPAMTSVLCGKARPGHFQGVAAIVTKLLSLVQPTKAYFGQKDAQQLAIIRKLVFDFNLPVEIVACPIVREESGLAMSSRNQYLTAEQKQQASVLYRALQQASETFSSGDRTAAAALAAAHAAVTEEPAVKLEYAELVDPETLTPLQVVETSGTFSRGRQSWLYSLD